MGAFSFLCVSKEGSSTSERNVVETFSYIGGYVGIWLGVSLLALFDFLEATMFLIRYPFRKRKRLGAPKTT
ncbi:hypothetical protein TNCT_80981 [Trichonephila clavata]|uniref:Uncharacterized protein n=1 Tax=Trichonephila clavata TaxID=2740835 RepID=A0A8X6IY41_TRICU|nr:hypothetical protein TNCT_80981 [Trichonephila clavata]